MEHLSPIHMVKHHREIHLLNVTLLSCTRARMVFVATILERSFISIKNVLRKKTVLSDQEERMHCLGLSRSSWSCC